MPVQTSNTSYVYFPDGAKVEIKASGDVSYTDVGAIAQGVTAVLNYDENAVITGNAGELRRQIRNMTMQGEFTLINFDPDAIEKLGGGLFTKVTTTDSPDTGVVDQTIASGDWAYNTPVNLVLTNAAGDNLVASAVPTLTSVTGGTDGALVNGTDYHLVSDENSPSGYSIMLVDSLTITTLTQAIVINYASVTPVADTTIYAGDSTETLSAYAMKITHTDDNGKTRSLELFSVDTNSGGFAFNFKGANEDGTEELPVAFKAKIDSTKTTGRQLFSWTVQAGAE